MKSSNLFSDYMVASSVNRSIRSINNSPTSGVIHKQRSSYGPRLTLVNKSRDQSMSKSRQNLNEQQHENNENDKNIQKIFLLMLQTNRLQQLHQQLTKQSSQSMRQSKLQLDKQIIHYKQTNQTLKIAIKTLQGSLMKCEEEKMRMKMQYQQRVGGLELQVKTMSLRLTQTQKQVERLRKDKQQLMLQIQKQSIQNVAKSSSISQSRAFLLQNQQQQRTKQHQLTYQISSLRQQLSRYKLTLQQQQQIIRKLKQQHQMIKQRQRHLLIANHQYASEFEEMKRRANCQLVNKQMNTQIQFKDMVKKDSIQQEYVQMRQQITTLQYELSQKHKQYVNKQKRQNDVLVGEIKEKQGQVNNLRQQLKQRQMAVSQLKLTNDMLRQKMQKLNTHANQRQFWSSKKIQSIQHQLREEVRNKQQQVKELKDKNKQLMQQNIVMKQYIEEREKNMNIKQLEYSVQNIDLQNRLKRTQRRLKSVKKGEMLKGVGQYGNSNGYNNKNNGENIYVNHSTTAMPQTRLFKSRSIQSTSFFSYNNNNNQNNTTNNLNRKSLINLNLQNIVTATVNLQGSNERSLRLINRSQQKLITSCMSPIKSKRKVFVQINNGGASGNNDKISSKQYYQQEEQQNNSEISFQQGKTKYRNKVSSATKKNSSRYYIGSGNNNNNNNNDDLRSSIHEYYGLTGEDNAYGSG